MPNSKTSKASYVSKTRRVTLEKYKILNRNSRKELKTEKLKKNSKLKKKNSKLKPKTQEFGIFASPSCRKNGQKTSLG